MRLDAVLFDAVGTLFTLREPVGETYARLARPHGIDLPAWRLEDAFRRIVKRAGPCHFPDAPGRRERIECEREWWRQVVRGTFLATDQTLAFPELDAYFAQVFDHYARAAAWTLREGAKPGLAELRRRGLRTGVVSNFDHRLPDLLQDIGIANLFDLVAIPVDTGLAKPDPRAFTAAVEALGAVPEASLFVGDDAEKDLAAARKAGLAVLGVEEAPPLDALPAHLASIATLPG